MQRYNMEGFAKRHAISRSHFFLDIAKRCPIESRDEFEAYLEASIIFARAALHRFQSEHKHLDNWKPWWDELLSNPSVIFFRKERDWILKEGPPKIGQVIRGDKPLAPMAAEFYYFENPQIAATDTVEKHLNTLEAILIEAQCRFSKPEVR
jgi:hypothetical protein